MRRTCGRLLGSRWPSCSSTRAAVVADVVHRDVVDDGLVVDVCDVVDVIDRAIVEERSVVPISALIARTDITKAIEDPAIETNLWSPVAGIPNVGLVLPRPISGSPQEADGSKHPGAGHPIVSITIVVSPVAGRPNVTVSRTNRLLVDGQCRWSYLN